ncbi:MAG TPA: type IX secretion system membrane protein PorP/SprF [Flavobacterium sp.]|jgi:type IX secretion system PorP/SprF family membrane protein|nr:type IX secretion system membrane protein PorP/SprF [Saprospiraceae bacterium]HQV36825.1 type IX secretion system membrane protein PorP/SprF [Flavobacterium sp.]HQX04712.1 type IX secretion system membrane protein PorP/SprF [Flavobacterium sp.]HRZ31520.1 type IX secretion system membrane protein PorP/SprF [Flavobacterium sp.]HRZ73815.1 type IX secretion system membrane protein PorP/SprF [Flavobacterium sp.]
MRTKFLFFALMLTGFAGFAQQDAQYTQYMYNTINVNPAYAGSRGVMSIFGLHRTQWVGLDGAPVTNTASINTPINESNLGLGLSFVNDRIGPTNENTISADLSYSINTSETYKLSFGIKASANLFNLDVNKLNPADQGDPQFADLENKFTPNIGAGVYFHSDKTYFGLSVPSFFETTRYDDNSVAINKERMSFYFIAGHVFDLSYNLKFKPALMTKATEGAPLQVDLSANFLIMDKFVLGAAWRWDAAVSAMAGFQVSDGLYIGYGYDMETTELKNYNSGSHEVFLRFELFQRHNKIVSPRFF